MVNLDTVTIASFIAVAALGITRLLTTAKPLWDLLPPSVQGIIPALVLVLPQVAEKAAGVHTGLDLANLLVLAAALIIPGVHSHTVALVKPSGPSSGASVGLIFALALPLTACGFFAAEWPKIAEHCAPSKVELLQDVEAVLAKAPDLAAVEAELKQIALTQGKDAVECAVQQAVNDLAAQVGGAQDERAIKNGRAFLAKVQK